MELKQLYSRFSKIADHGRSLALFLSRLTIAYGFYGPAMTKWRDIDAVAQWFGSIGIPFPTINAYMAATTEITGVVLLTLGFLTRLISIPLIVVMIVAIITVHLPNGFAAGDNGFEIPFYYMMFLLLFLTDGAGGFSLDRVIFGEKN